MTSPAEALEKLLSVLDRMEIPYFVGGSVAGSSYGLPRTTMDVDLVVDLKDNRVEEFTTLLGEEFYADAEFIRESFRHGRPANVIHHASAYKFDLFPLRADEFSQLTLQRRAVRTIEALPDRRVECALASPEDTVLRKLEWYSAQDAAASKRVPEALPPRPLCAGLLQRLGGETSQRQWNDLKGILAIMGNRLDHGYLRQWAERLHVADLLEKLLAEM